ncbi:hypothetical protein E4U31_000896 [Claviceps sp. LM219 group G6]|nr:hypothetical protein E4U31_000896 [Claviceps sp. LM219 group G6]
MCQGHIFRMPVSRLGSTHPSVYPGGGSKIRASIFSSSASIHGDCLVHPTESSAYLTDLAHWAVLHSPVRSLRDTMRWLQKHSTTIYATLTRPSNWPTRAQGTSNTALYDDG